MTDAPHATDSPTTTDPPRRRLTVSRRVALALVALLISVLGFAIVVQLRSHSAADSLSGLREDDLIRILDDQNARSDRLQQQISQLRATLAKLQASDGRDAAAREQAEQEAQALGVLLGTLPATGPGITLTITDPQHGLKAENLLDVVEELRGAGAEAVQFGPVRITTASNFSDQDGAVVLDDVPLSAPYTVLAIGDPATLDTALNIPGGVAAVVRAAGGTATITQQKAVAIKVTRSVPTPKYATPSR